MRPWDRAIWLVVVSVVLGVLIPAASLIWFMTEAARNQADAARQRLSDALRGQLRLLQERLDSDWRARLERLHTATGAGDAARAFQQAALAGHADAIVILGRAGDAYPALPPVPIASVTPGPAARPDWAMAGALEASESYRAAATAYAAIAAREKTANGVARAAQAHVRSLLKGGRTEEAGDALETYLATPRVAGGRDRAGRLLPADAQLMALKLATGDDGRFETAMRRLLATVNDYDGIEMPSAQRLFLMSELRALAGSAATMPTFEAERLAAAFIEGDGAVVDETLQPSAVPGVWKVRAGDGVVALFTTGTLHATARTLLQEQSAASGARFELLPPGNVAGPNTLAVSPLLPGWLVGFSLADAERLDRAAARRTAGYLWAGSAAVAGLAVAGLLLAQAFRRQLRVNRLKTDLVAAVSHELRTPLASMRALVDLMLEDPAIDRVRARDYLQMIAGENARLSRLIEHFLAFSRVDRHRHQLVFRSVSLDALLTDAAGAAGGAHRFAGLTIEVAPDLPPLYGDADALTTVVLNLLENAYKYSDGTPRVTLRATQEGPSVVIEVEDQGIGIARRDLKRIFQPFYQVDQRLARERGGCGLGLSIVDFIVRAHGGRVSVESQPGVGSCFRVVLPARVAGREVAA